MRHAFKDRRTLFLVVVAALGYFVDIYDLVLFQVVKKESLESIGLSGDVLKHYDFALLNWQMGGMLLGGLVWGILGDRKGRITVLFGSILIYSLANIGNAFVTTTSGYALCRVIAGFGLAGELGSGITLVVESMDRTQRGWGTMIIVTVGVLGGVVAQLVGGEGAAWSHALGLSFSGWQMTYLVGGAMGLALLALRAGALESGLYKKAIDKTDVVKGDIRMLFNNGRRAAKYFGSVAIGLPVWFTIGVLISQSDIIAKTIGVNGTVNVGASVMWCYFGTSVGDLLSGAISQWMRSRRKVILGWLAALIICIAVYILGRDVSLAWFHFLCFMLGVTTGFWTLFVTVASEQFGTNLRSTVTNTVPNIVRGATIPITLAFQALYPAIGVTPAVLLVGSVCMALAIIGTLTVEETFSKEMDFMEG